MPVALLALALPAVADPWDGAPVARAGEVPEVGVYGRIDGDGPVTARWKRRSGPYTVWTFEDGLVEHLHHTDGAVATVWLAQPVDVDVSAWEAVDLGGVTVTVPPGAVVADGRLAAAGDGWTLAAAAQPGEVNPLATSFLEGLRATCACALTDAVATWVDGQPGVRFRAAALAEDPPSTQELFLVSSPAHTLFLAISVAPDAPPERLAVGRAVAALARFAEAPK